MNGAHNPAAKLPKLGSRAWIFQANPSKYRIEDSLWKESEEFWNLNQHADEVMIGDQVLVWLSGKDAGIYALGQVMTMPVMTADSPIGQEYWIDKAQGRRAKARVRVRYSEVFLERPLLKEFIACDPDLWNLTILRQPRGTNFSVSKAEWEALKSWLTGNIL